MINYRKGENVEEELTKEKIPIECLPEKFLWMHVKGGTKISNVVDYAKKALDSNEYRSIVWTGTGGGVGKTISCTEIIKRNYDVHQVTRLCYQKIEEHWDPIMKDLEPIVASRRIPCIHILTSLDAIDPKTSGYQTGKNESMFWNDPTRMKQYPLPNYHDQIRAKYGNIAGGAGGDGNKKQFKKKNKGKQGGEKKAGPAAKS